MLFLFCNCSLLSPFLCLASEWRKRWILYLLGHSVCCLVHGFEPYFYISCPQGMGPDDISCFHQTLEVKFDFSFCQFSCDELYYVSYHCIDFFSLIFVFGDALQ